MLPFLLFGTLYLAAAGTFYTYLVATAQPMPREIADAMQRLDPVPTPAIRSLHARRAVN